MKMRYGVIALMLLAAVALTGCNGGGKGSAAVDNCTGVTSKWGLWSGNTCLRGANVWQRTNNNTPPMVAIYGTSLGPNPYGPVFTQVDFNNLAAMGANVVYISHPGLYSEVAPYGLNSAAQTNLDNLLTMAKNANMYAVISFRTGPGRNEEDIFRTGGVSGTPPPAEPLINSYWTNTAEQQAWVNMWKYTASRYMSNPIVVGYELMVEPHFSLPLSPPNDWNSLAKTMSAAIRTVDANTPILIGGMQYGSVSGLAGIVPTGDSKTVYAVHQYEPCPVGSCYTSQPAPLLSYGTAGVDNYSRVDLLSIFANVASFKSLYADPVAVSEFGAMRYVPGAIQFLDDQMSIMETNGLNYSLWDWETTDPAYALQGNDSFNFRRGTISSNHTDQVPNQLMDTIKKYFQKNTARPSNRGY